MTGRCAGRALITDLARRSKDVYCLSCAAAADCVSSATSSSCRSSCTSTCGTMTCVPPRARRTGSLLAWRAIPCCGGTIALRSCVKRTRWSSCLRIGADDHIGQCRINLEDVMSAGSVSPPTLSALTMPYAARPNTVPATVSRPKLGHHDLLLRTTCATTAGGILVQSVRQEERQIPRRCLPEREPARPACSRFVAPLPSASVCRRAVYGADDVCAHRAAGTDTEHGRDRGAHHVPEETAEHCNTESASGTL